MKQLKDCTVLGYSWHTGHQYELAKLFKEYHFVENFYRSWSEKSRVKPDNIKMVLEPKKEDYDFAVLHFDQEVVLEGGNKYNLFTEMKRLTEGMPRVIINHMTPFSDKLETVDVIRKAKQLIGNIPMITNSKEAAKQWGWGTPIIHGLSPEEWLDLPKEPRIITVASSGGMESAYRRSLLHTVIDILEQKGIPVHWVLSTVKPKDFEEYRQYIGRSLIYLHVLRDSPMPRSRTEAMLSGCCIVSTRHQDWEEYIEDGINGFIMPDNPETIARTVEDLLMNKYNKAVEIGKRGKKTAQERLCTERWRTDWQKFIEEVIWTTNQQ